MGTEDDYMILCWDLKAASATVFVPLPCGSCALAHFGAFFGSFFHTLGTYVSFYQAYILEAGPSGSLQSWVVGNSWVLISAVSSYIGGLGPL